MSFTKCTALKSERVLSAVFQLKLVLFLAKDHHWSTGPAGQIRDVCCVGQEACRYNFMACSLFSLNAAASAKPQLMNTIGTMSPSTPRFAKNICYVGGAEARQISSSYKQINNPLVVDKGARHAAR